MPAQPRTSSGGGDRRPAGPPPPRPRLPRPRRARAPAPAPALRHRQAARARVDRLHGRRAVLGVEQGRQGRRDARGRPARRPARRRHYLIVGSRLARRPHRGAAQGARHRRRVGAAHRHDHAAAHRRRPQHADVDPARLDRRHPRTRRRRRSTPPSPTAGPSCWSRPSSRTPGSASTTTSRSASAASSNIVDAVGGIEICPKTGMKDPLANLDIKKGCQEVDGETALGYARSRHTSASSATSTAPGTSARSSRAHRREGEVSPWTFINPVRYCRAEHGRRRRRSRSARGPARSRWAASASAMTRVNGDERPHLRRADRRPRGPWDRERSQRCSGDHRGRHTDEHPREASAPTDAAAGRPVTATTRPSTGPSTTTASPR